MNRGEKRAFFYLGIFLFLALLPFLSPAESDSLLNIPNSAPTQNQTIPDQSWPANTSLQDVFDLDDYFEDAEDNLTFFFTNPNNITVVLSSENLVSFVPDSEYVGTSNMTFIASDGSANTSSNVVTLYVGVDVFPPKWFNPRIDKEKVYQNNYVLFSTDWTDNFGMYNYTLYVNQEGNWSEYNGTISGASVTASHSVQISSPAGKIIQWKMCGSDTSYNTNCTDVLQFDVLTEPVNPPSSGGGPSGGGGGGGSGGISGAIKQALAKQNSPDYSLNTNSFVVNVKQGESKTRILEISNTGNVPLNFTLSVQGVEEYIELSDTYFELFPGEKKTVTVDFRAEFDTPLGEYFGEMVIDSLTEAILPIAIFVNDVDLEFDLVTTVLNEESFVKPGRNVVAKMEMKNVKDQILVDATLQYAVKDFKGTVYNSAEEKVQFDSSLSLERELEVDLGTPLGPYIFYARVFNEKTSAVNSDSFEVGTKFKFAAFLRASFIFIMIAILSLVILFLVLRYRKNLDKTKALNLYVKLNEIREFIRKGKFDKAADSYLGLKRIYGERVSEDVINDKLKLSKEIEELSKQIDLSEVPQDKPSTGKKKGEKKEGEEKDEGESEGEEDKESEAPAPAQKPAPAPVAKPAAKPVAKTAPAKVVKKPVIVSPKIVAKPVAKPVVKTPVKTIPAKVVKKPVTVPVAKPVAKPAAKPVQPVAKPVAKTPVKTATPATKPAPAPAAKPQEKKEGVNEA